VLRIDSRPIMCFVFDTQVYFKLFLHVFHAYQCKWPIGPLFNKLTHEWSPSQC